MSVAAPAPWHLVVEFTGIDLDDDDVVDALVVDPSLHIEWSSSEGVTTAQATIATDSAEDAFTAVIDTAFAAAPDAAVLRLVDPLVTIGDIAEEAGVTRQAVRNWALGTRHSGFPRPLAIVGDGVRVWRHAEVDAWLTAAVDLGSGHRYPTARFVLALNEHLGALQHDDGDWQVASQPTEIQEASVEQAARRTGSRSLTASSRR